MDILAIPPIEAGALQWQETPGQWALTVVCKLTFALEPGVSPLAGAQESVHDRDHLREDDLEGEVYTPCDLVPYKPSPEVLLVGSVFAPRGAAARPLFARLSAGSVDKSIEIIPRAEPAPAIGLGPLPLQWCSVVIGATPVPGSAGVSAVRIEIPLGADLDGACFQSAPEDQRVEELHADEAIVLEHMHPRAPRFATRLPGIRPRTRVEIEGMPPWELDLVPDTLWIDTDRAICTLAFRGQLPLDGRDQPGCIFIGLERPGEAVQFPAAPAAGRPGCGVAFSPDDPDDVELTQTNDAALDRTGIQPVNFAPSPALPFGSKGPERSKAPAPPPARPSREPPEDLGETSKIMVGAVRARVPSWLDGAAEPAADPPAAVPPPPAFVPAPPPPALVPAPPPPVAAPAPPALMAPPSPAVAPAPVASAPVRTTVGQALASADHRFAPPLAPPAPPSQEPLPPGAGPRPRKADPRALATAAFLGAADASTAAAVSLDDPADRAAEKKDKAPAVQAASPAPARTLVELLWFAPDLPPRLRENDRYKRLFPPEKAPPEPPEEPLPEAPPPDGEAPSSDALPPPPPPRKKKPAPGPEKSAEEKARDDRAGVARVLTGAQPTLDVEGALFSAATDDGVLEPPLLVVPGDLELPFDEIETLKVLVRAAAPLAVGDKKLKETLDIAEEALATPLGSSPEVAATFSARVRDAWIKANRILAPDYLDVHSRRVLLEQRRYQLRELMGAQWIRALLHGPMTDRPIPTYVPADLAKRLPLFVRFPARLIAEALLPQEQTETSPVALRALALARTVSGRPRRP